MDPSPIDPFADTSTDLFVDPRGRPKRSASQDQASGTKARKDMTGNRQESEAKTEDKTAPRIVENAYTGRSGDFGTLSRDYKNFSAVEDTPLNVQNLLASERGDRSEDVYIMELGTVLFEHLKNGGSLLAVLRVPPAYRTQVLFEAIARADVYFTRDDLLVAKNNVSTKGSINILPEIEKTTKELASRPVLGNGVSVYPVPGAEHAFRVYNGRLYFAPVADDGQGNRVVVSAGPIGITLTGKGDSAPLKRAKRIFDKLHGAYPHLLAKAKEQYERAVEDGKASFALILATLLVLNNPYYKTGLRETKKLNSNVRKAVKKVEKRAFVTARRSYNAAVVGAKQSIKQLRKDSAFTNKEIKRRARALAAGTVYVDVAEGDSEL